MQKTTLHASVPTKTVQLNKRVKLHLLRPCFAKLEEAMHSDISGLCMQNGMET
jgi:hypothetical protein